MSKKSGKLGRGGQAVVRELPDGRKLSIQHTPSGPRGHVHEGGNTTSVDPAAYGVAEVRASEAAGGRPRLTVRTPDGAAIDYTARSGDGTSTVVHHAGESNTRS